MRLGRKLKVLIISNIQQINLVIYEHTYVDFIWEREETEKVPHVENRTIYILEWLKPEILSTVDI